MRSDKSVLVITIDGPSGTGKGTICHRLAHHLHWNALDSGSIYRVLALAARKKALNWNEESALVQLAYSLNLKFETSPEQKLRILLDGKDVFEEIRSEQCGQDASKIASLGEVRKALLSRQRAFAKPPGLVTDGRDMGTVVFPDAFLKFYLYASLEERAFRRYLQLKEIGIDASLAKVVDELADRDARDSSRLHAPLKPAEDAIFIDTTDLTIVQVFDNVLKLVDKHLLL